MPVRITLDHAAIERFLKFDPGIRAALISEADAAASRARSELEALPPLTDPAAEVAVTPYTGRSRAVVSIALKHPAARPLEAKHGVLSRAARGLIHPYKR